VAIVSYLEYSNRDLKYAHDMLKLKNYDPCGRFCQQSVEKRFKHFIEINGTTDDIPLLHTHNLVKLYNRVCAITQTQPDRATRGDLYQLTIYYFDTNYPSQENVELSREMAEEAVDIAMRVNNWIDSI
jgi:HEPN domain-containing protein